MAQINCIDTIGDAIPIEVRPASAFLAGMRAVAPILLGVVPFATVAGAAAVEAGFTPLEAAGMSVIVFAGLAQLTAIELIGRQAPLTIVVLTALVVNLRFVMYSASIAPHFARLSGRWRALLPYLLTDQGYAVFVTRYREVRHGQARHWFFLGAGVALWSVWQIGTIAGAVLGARVPPEWSLDFAVPLTMLALLCLSLRDRPTSAAAVAAGATLVLVHGLPLNLGLIVASGAGIVAGAWAESRRDRVPREAAR